jgi:cobalt/nickel transport system ATP-binding protein
VSDDALLVVNDVHYRYLDRFVALDDVSLTVRAGERVALLGANGCGKSTLLKILDGLIFPERGELHAFGSPVTESALEDEEFSRGFRSRVGFVFQSSDAQLFSPTVRDEIAFGPRHMGLVPDEIEQRVADALTLLEIDAIADRAPYQLSGGQKKRVAIASVLVMNPEVLLFDEPTAALDPRTQHWLRALIEELHQVGKTIVVATHDLAALDALADRCVVISEAHTVVADVTPTELLHDQALMRSVNLVHDHSHTHGSVTHRHEHAQDHHEPH